jgi:Cof subfamily protein (haloacid dehalogenase superfamily)
MGLYVSDLDGTLLNANQEISIETAEVLNNLIEKGLKFSIATARSISSVEPILERLNLNIPIILHNGVLVYDYVKKKKILTNYIPQDIAANITKMCEAYGFSPLVFTSDQYVGDKVYYKGIFNEGERHFINERLLKGDKRFKLSVNFDHCIGQAAVTIIIIGQEENINLLYNILRDKFNMAYHYTQDIYSKFYWLEITNKAADKGTAAQYLKSYLNAQKLICFGDNLNDWTMFEAADEKYAVSNAHHKLKENATKVIDSNDEDGVAKFISATWK